MSVLALRRAARFTQLPGAEPATPAGRPPREALDTSSIVTANPRVARERR